MPGFCGNRSGAGSLPRSLRAKIPAARKFLNQIMPVTSKTRWSQMKVGLMALAALSILAFLIFLMSGVRGFFQSKSVVYTYLGDSAAIAEGADVRLNGILIGKVSKVELSGMSDPGRVVRVTMQIDDRFMNAIPVDSQAGLSAANLLGVKFINIKRGR